MTARRAATAKPRSSGRRRGADGTVEGSHAAGSENLEHVLALHPRIAGDRHEPPAKRSPRSLWEPKERFRQSMNALGSHSAWLLVGSTSSWSTSIHSASRCASMSWNEPDQVVDLGSRRTCLQRLELQSHRTSRRGGAVAGQDGALLTVQRPECVAFRWAGSWTPSRPTSRSSTGPASCGSATTRSRRSAWSRRG